MSYCNVSERDGKGETYAISVIRFIDDFEKIIDEIYNEDKEYLHWYDSYFGFRVEDKRLTKVLKNYNKILNTSSQFLKFEFGHSKLGKQTLSSGETAYLSLYSRIHSIKNELQELGNNILLLLDEPDLYLHPKWQQEMIYNLCQYLPLIFPDKYIQIVITSHSPVITSDLPVNNIAFLDKKDNTLPIGTFGRNIHELYKHAFSINDALMGKFAKEKIRAIIKDVNNLGEKENETFLTSLEKRIKIIGEPIIRRKLEDKFLKYLESKKEENLKDYYDKKKNELFKLRVEELKKQLNIDDTSS